MRPITTPPRILPDMLSDLMIGTDFTYSTTAMGFDDTFRIVVPDTAAYKQAGNSIIVDVLIALLRQMDITQYGI